jgi:hypothetical protein
MRVTRHQYCHSNTQLHRLWTAQRAPFPIVLVFPWGVNQSVFYGMISLVLIRPDAARVRKICNICKEPVKLIQTEDCPVLAVTGG